MAALKELQRDLENKANDLNKLQKGILQFFCYSYPNTHRYTLFVIIVCWNQLFVYDVTDISKNHQVRKKYTIQLGENELVLKVGYFVWLCISESFFSEFVMIPIDVYFWHAYFFFFFFFNFQGTGFVEWGCECVQAYWSSACETGFGWGQCKCSKENWLHLSRIVCSSQFINIWFDCRKRLTILNELCMLVIWYW